MKVAFLCPFGHLTIINKPEEAVGKIIPELQCTKLNCGCAMHIFEAYQIDESVQATHEFFSKSDVLLTLEEMRFVNSGYLLFKEIPSMVPAENKKEFVATEGINKLASHLINNTDPEERLPDIIDTAIKFIDLGLKERTEQSVDTKITIMLPKPKPEDIN